MINQFIYIQNSDRVNRIYWASESMHLKNDQKDDGCMESMIR